MEYYSATRKKVIMPFATTWIKVKGIMLTETSQTDKDKYHDMNYMENLKKLNSQK